MKTMFREIPYVSDLSKVCVSLVVVMPHPYTTVVNYSSKEKTSSGQQARQFTQSLFLTDIRLTLKKVIKM
jgi:hypothetical protein